MGAMKDWILGGQEMLDHQHEKVLDIPKRSGVSKAIERARYEGMLEMFRTLTDWDVICADPYSSYHELVPLKKSS